MKKILLNAHTHTVASGHAYSSLQEMAKEAHTLLAETDFPDELIMNYRPDRFFEYLGIQK